jgi:hypothetical protein
MVNFTYFGETYTDNVWIHDVNYTVSKFHSPVLENNALDTGDIMNSDI